MNERGIEELANEVAAEFSRDIKRLKMLDVDTVGDALRLTLSWEEPTHIEVTIDLHESDTDESVKSKVRSQLQAVPSGICKTDF
jgi:hypothetical protein